MSDASAAPLYLEDFREGQRFVSASREVTAAEIKAFAAAFDPQPFHLDEAAAERSFFGGLAASGWHTAALTMRLLVDGGLPVAGGVIGASGALSWPRPTRPGDVLHVECDDREGRALALAARPGHADRAHRDPEPARRDGAALRRQRHRVPPPRRLRPAAGITR